MQLLDHISITVHDLSKVKAFYIAVMQTLGAEIAYEEAKAIGFGERNSHHDSSHSYISVFESPQANSDMRRHVCFRAQSVAQVDAFYAAGMAHDGGCAGAPGLRRPADPRHPPGLYRGGPQARARRAPHPAAPGIRGQRPASPA